MGVDITLRDARTLIENSIVDNLAWAYGRRLFTVADTATLRTKASGGLVDRTMCTVTAGGGYAWMFRLEQLSADDDQNYVQPADVPGGKPGRWCRVSVTGANSSAAAGYLKRCELYNDDNDDIEVFAERLFGQVPAMLLSFDGIERQPKSIEPGALDWCTARFTLFAVSFNPRGGQTARQGSPVPAEFADDPGTAAMLGDAKTVLKGASLGINDVAYVRIENEDPLVKDQARSRFIDTLAVTVYYTETLPDPTLVPLGDPYMFNLNFRLAGLDGAGEMDANNAVTSPGLQFPLGDGLAKTFAGGTMDFNGSPLTVPGGSHTFTAAKVTYRDVDSVGGVHYSETNFGDAPPALVAGQVRLGVTFADSTGVRLDRLLAAQLIPFGPTDEVDPAYATITISPTNLSLPVGTDLQFTAIAMDDAGNPVDVTDRVAWSSDNLNTTLSSTGVARTTATGTAHITATLNGVTSNTATLAAI